MLLEITPQNILLEADNETIFQRAEREEQEDPSSPILG
jgi:serine/threonine-protein kinase SRPK3